MKTKTFGTVLMLLVAFAASAKTFEVQTGDILRHLSNNDFLSKYEDTDEDNGGPSSEFRPMGYDWSKEDLGYDKRGVDTECLERKRTLATNNGVTPEELCAKEKDFFSKLPKVLRNLEKILERTLKKARIQGIVTGRIKGLHSLVNKMNGDKITDVREITDIVGLRVTLQTLSDIRAFKRAFLGSYNKKVTEIRCYGTCGPDVGSNDKRQKKYWPMKPSGYRRLHFKVKVSSLETEAEIQVGTPYMTLWAEWEHAAVYKGPEHLHNDKKVRSYAQRLAEYYMMLDNIRDGMNVWCPKALRSTSARDIFSDRDWKVFGEPNDACNFWNDLRVDMP
ncbi:uncharacterized protein LOC114517211 [Dendronephthya gigantea]|uniref:uncharacterized protein LOC114517211 n=1 Tax=Dendronephthya gigantea TaxID=151771 RepID=UPI00106C3AD5|nr:uncharacterized protein LOC114517211 [Dendronephthya gigantea]